MLDIESPWCVTGRFHEQSDVICIAEKYIREGIYPIAVGGGHAIAKVWGRVGKMFACDSGSLEREVGGPVEDRPVD